MPYELEYKRSVDSTYTVHSTILTAANFPRTIPGLIPGTTYNVRCRARDASGNLSAYSAVSSATTNPSTGPPVWTTVPTITFTQGTAANISISSYVSDPDGDPLTITHTAGTFPTGVSYNQSLKRYEYDGVGAVAGNNGHILTADDAIVNQPPVWQSSVNQSLTQSQAFSLNLDTLCADPESAPLTYTILSGTLPPGLAQSGARGQIISGTPTTVGAPTITFRATD